MCVGTSCLLFYPGTISDMHTISCILEADSHVVEDVAVWLFISLIDHDKGPCFGVQWGLAIIRDW